MMTTKEFVKGINPHGIPYVDMTKGKSVVVDIPIDHDGNCAEVEGIISQNIWCGSPNVFYSQIKMVRQNTEKEKIALSGGLYAIYPEKVRMIS